MATIPGPGGLGFAIAAPYHGTVLATHGQVDDQQQLLHSVNVKDSTTGYMDFDIFVD